MLRGLRNRWAGCSRQLGQVRSSRRSEVANPGRVAAQKRAQLRGVFQGFDFENELDCIFRQMRRNEIRHERNAVAQVAESEVGWKGGRSRVLKPGMTRRRVETVRKQSDKT